MLNELHSKALSLAGSSFSFADNASPNTAISSVDIAKLGFLAAIWFANVKNRGYITEAFVIAETKKAKPFL